MVLQPPYFAYFLVDEQGRCYVVNNSLVSTTAQRIPLDYSPDGWQETSLLFERDMKHMGLSRRFGLPYGYVMDGAQILRKIFYEQNIEAKIYLLIQQLTLEKSDDTFLWHYKFFYKGQIDLPKLQDEELKVTVPTTEGGMQQLFEANRDTVYEIPFDKDAIKVQVDGLNLYQTINFIVPSVETTGDEKAHLIGAAFTTKDGDAAGLAVFQQFYENLETVNNPAEVTTDFSTDTRFLFATTQVIEDITLSGAFRVRNLTNTEATFTAELYTSKGRRLGVAFATLPADRTAFTEIPISRTFDAQPDEHFFLVGKLGGFFEGIEYGESSFTMNLHSRYRTSVCLAFKPLDLFKKLTVKMGMDADKVSSTLLEQVKNITVTCGNAIRGLQGSAIKTSMSEFLEMCRTEHAAGFGFENGKLVVEAFAHFLNTTQVLHLGNAKELKVTVAQDLICNTVKVGYPDQDISGVNGKYEPNNTYTFTSPITSVVRELNLVCPYLAQPYLIETIRLNLEGKVTTDNSQDNATFLLHANLSLPITLHATAMETLGTDHFVFTGATGLYEAINPGDTFTLSGTNANDKTYTVISRILLIDGRLIVYVEGIVVPETITADLSIALPLYPLMRPGFDEIEGVPVDSQIFNIDYVTPTEMVLRHMPYINSIMDGFAGQELVYQTTEKNAALVTRKGIKIIRQSGNVLIGNQKLFTPKQFDFENEVPVELADYVDQYPNGAFSFDWLGYRFVCFSRNMGIAPNTMKEQSFKMLCAPVNNLKTLE